MCTISASVYVHSWAKKNCSCLYFVFTIKSLHRIAKIVFMSMRAPVSACAEFVYWKSSKFESFGVNTLSENANTSQRDGERKKTRTDTEGEQKLKYFWMVTTAVKHFSSSFLDADAADGAFASPASASLPRRHRLSSFSAQASHPMPMPMPIDLYSLCRRCENAYNVHGPNGWTNNTGRLSSSSGCVASNVTSWRCRKMSWNNLSSQSGTIVRRTNSFSL